MSGTTVEEQTKAYEQALRAAIADLPAAEVDELTEDLREYVAEIRAEQPSASLDDVLGPPERFAEEFRAAAGYAGHEEPGAGASAGPSGRDSGGDQDAAPGRWRPWLFPFGVLAYAAGAVCFTISIVNVGNEGYALPSGALFLLGLLIAISGHRYLDPVSRAVGTFVAARPWLRVPGRIYSAVAWVLRGWGVVVLVDWYVIGGRPNGPEPTGFPLPHYLGLDLGISPGTGAMGGLIVIVAAVLVSVWLGLRERRIGRWRALVVPVELVFASAPILAAVSYTLHF